MRGRSHGRRSEQWLRNALLRLGRAPRCSNCRVARPRCRHGEERSEALRDGGELIDEVMSGHAEGAATLRPWRRRRRARRAVARARCRSGAQRSPSRWTVADRDEPARQGQRADRLSTRDRRRGSCRLAQERGVELGVVATKVSARRAGPPVLEHAATGRCASHHVRRIPWMCTGPTRNHHRRRGDQARPTIVAHGPASMITTPTCRT